jgi:hypothetical protein
LRYYLFLFICLLSPAAFAQVVKGIVTDAQTGNPLSVVMVVNTVTQQSVYTSKEGEFAITAKSGERLAFSYMGYKTMERLSPPVINIATMHIELQRLSVEMDELVVRPGYTSYQLDPARRRETYARVLAEKKRTSIMSPVSLIADKFSKRRKRIYAFQKSFNYWENQLFIDSRYTPETVNKLTGLTGDTLAHFMNANPMPVDYARAASDLELKMWVRDRYKRWLSAPKADSTSVVK